MNGKGVRQVAVSGEWQEIEELCEESEKQNGLESVADY
jgi:hypothetical protein